MLTYKQVSFFVLHMGSLNDLDEMEILFERPSFVVFEARVQFRATTSQWHGKSLVSAN
jgi:hypothetical protein